jgi:hypothetical protein
MSQSLPYDPVRAASPRPEKFEFIDNPDYSDQAHHVNRATRWVRAARFSGEVRNWIDNMFCISDSDSAESMVCNTDNRAHDTRSGGYRDCVPLQSKE